MIIGALRNRRQGGLDHCAVDYASAVRHAPLHVRIRLTSATGSVTASFRLRMWAAELTRLRGVSKGRAVKQFLLLMLLSGLFLPGRVCAAQDLDQPATFAYILRNAEGVPRWKRLPEYR